MGDSLKFKYGESSNGRTYYIVHNGQIINLITSELTNDWRAKQLAIEYLKTKNIKQNDITFKWDSTI